MLELLFTNQHQNIQPAEFKSSNKSEREAAGLSLMFCNL